MDAYLHIVFYGSEEVCLGLGQRKAIAQQRWFSDQMYLTGQRTGRLSLESAIGFFSLRSKDVSLETQISH